ncbi:GNAT family N-acetyltransferase [Paractinoplanes durhamensis]|uniref:N-acetyltransferase domain-containing protein n=1 Tax=Paractinoplanes durhamensis TaxID=113563 RepID=A0ABQ3ZBZ2_9ACTN|nr:GNAT family N-acetyltransferase [Actinoplanes durhamensis]GIE07336.1 hypothetical protein Adu01nite_86860 [Actinoplanes durhamensis]
MSNFWLEPWDERGRAFERRANTAEMQAYLGGVESDDTLAARHQRYLDLIRDGSAAMFLILVPDEPDPVGSVGYWAKEWLGQTVFELGWKVLPSGQGRGLAAGATVEALGRAAAEKRHRWAHAYPRVDNAASNAVCRKAGFALRDEVDFEYPKGNPIRCNDWRFDLEATGS